MHYVHMLFWSMHTFLFYGDTAMCKQVKRIIIILTAISVMLTLTVSPVMGEQYSDAEGVSLLHEDSEMWEESAAETPTEYMNENAAAEEMQPASAVNSEEQPTYYGWDEEPLTEDRCEESLTEDWGMEQPAPCVPEGSAEELPEPEASEEKKSSADIIDGELPELSPAYERDEEQFAR
jgi:hypothetical protein